MSLRRCLDDHALCLRAAGELLGETPRAVEVSWECEQLLRPHLRFELRRGIREEAPVLAFDTGRPGHTMSAGVARYCVVGGPSAFRIARVCVPSSDFQQSTYFNFWAVGRSRYRDFYRLLRRLERDSLVAPAPLLPRGDTERLYANTVGFLRRGCETLRRYGVPQRRGVLLLGAPGNGKTMACRWLRAACLRHGLACRNVSVEEFTSALADAQAHTLFQLPRPGLVFFDDFDAALRDRETAGTSAERSLFLSGLDGMDVRGGVVYIFTSNARLDELDPAIRRPGRLDFILTFRPPPPALRQDLLTTRWHPEVLDQLTVDQVVRETEGLSFAELEELKKLLVLQWVEERRCDWRRAWRDFHSGRGDYKPRPILGFAAPAAVPAEPPIPDTAAVYAS
jgi:cell division protease FtsH